MFTVIRLHFSQHFPFSRRWIGMAWYVFLCFSCLGSSILTSFWRTPGNSCTKKNNTFLAINSIKGYDQISPATFRWKTTFILCAIRGGANQSQIQMFAKYIWMHKGKTSGAVVAVLKLVLLQEKDSPWSYIHQFLVIYLGSNGWYGNMYSWKVYKHDGTTRGLVVNPASVQGSRRLLI